MNVARLPQLLLRRPLAPRPQQRVEPLRLPLQCTEDPQLPDDDVNRYDGPVPNDLIEGEVDGAAIEEKKNKS